MGDERFAYISFAESEQLKTLSLHVDPERKNRNTVSCVEYLRNGWQFLVAISQLQSIQILEFDSMGLDMSWGPYFARLRCLKHFRGETPRQYFLVPSEYPEFTETFEIRKDVLVREWQQILSRRLQDLGTSHRLILST